LGAIKTVRIVEELMEIWLNKVCDRPEGKIKALKVLVKVFIRKRGKRIKTNSTREMIDYPRTRRKERMKGIEAVSNPVEALINIFDRTFKIGLLFHSEVGSGSSVRGLIFSMLRVE